MMISESLARRYALALFNLARDRNILDQVFEEYSVIRKLFSDKENFRYFFISPKVDVSEKKKVLKTIFGGAVTPTTLYFLYLLLDKKRQTLLPYIYNHLVTFYNNHYWRAEITVKPAVSLNPRVKENLQKSFEKILGKSVTIREIIDPSLIGGLQVRVNNTIYDATVAAKLRAVKKTLVS